MGVNTTNASSQENNYSPIYYANKAAKGIYFWATTYPGDALFTSGVALTGIALGLIFGLGGTAAMAGLLLMILAGCFLCGKVCYPEDNYAKSAL